LMMERRVPGLRSQLEWTGTVTVRVPSPGEDHNVMTANDPICHES
jgi:hypothetical protein